MGVLKGVLEEERGRLKLVEKGCLREIAKLPVGSIRSRRRSRNTITLTVY